MPSSNQPSRAPRQSWRPETKRAQSPGSKIATRVTITVLGIVLAVVFFFVIWPMITPAPTLHVYSLSIPYRAALSRDFDDMHQTASLRDIRKDSAVLDPKRLGHLTGLKTLAGEIRSSANDVLVVYLSAAGVSDNGTAYLLCSDYDPTQNDSGRLELKAFLEQIQKCPARAKLLVLDTGWIDSDVRLGFMVNEFPRLLIEDSTTDSSLWILTSNSVGETSQSYHPACRSIFSYFVAQGLKGQADGYGIGNRPDQTINLKELWEYVRDHVSSWAETSSGGSESQTPRLVRNGQEVDADESLVLARLQPPARKQEKPEKPDKEPETKKDAAAARMEPSLIDRSSARRLFLANMQQSATKPDESGDRDKVSKGTQPESKTGEAAATKDQDKTATSPDSKEAPKTQESKPAEKKETAGGAVPSDSAPAGPVLPLLIDAWELRDQLEIRTDAPSPIDYAPHLWREFQAQLITFEMRSRCGLVDAQDQSDLVASITRLQEDVRRRLRSAEPKDVFRSLKNQPHTLAAASLLPWPEQDRRPWELFVKLQQQLAGLASAEAAEFEERFSEWISKPETKQAGFTAEINLAVRLQQKVQQFPNDSQRWSKVQLALATRELAERVAAYAPWCRPWVQKTVDDADIERAQGERDLFGVGDTSEQAMQSLRKARTLYRSAQQDADVIRRAYALKHDLTFYTPFLIRLPELQSGADPQRMINEIRQLTSVLEDPKADRLDEVRSLLSSLEKHNAGFAAALDRTVDRVALDPLGRANTATLERLLSTPLLRMPQRKRLLEAVTTAQNEAVQRLEKFSTLRGAPARSPDRATNLAKLEIDLARLGTTAPGTDAAHEAPLKTMAEHLDQADKALRAAIDSSAEGYWSGMRELGQALKLYYRAIPEAIQNSEESRDLASLQTRERWLRLMDARDVASISSTVATRQNPLEAIHHQRLFQLLAWHQDRLVRQRQIAAPADRADFTQAALACHRLAKAIPNQKDLDPPGSYENVAAMELSPPDELRLDRWENLTIRVSAIQRSEPVKVSLHLEFDPRLIEIMPPELGRETMESDARSLRISFDLLADEPKTFRVGMRARRPDDERSWIKAQLRVADRSNRLAQRVESEYSLNLNMPEPEVVHLKVTGLKGTVEQDKKTINLRPFPNRVNEYRIELTTQKPREVRVIVLALAESLDAAEKRNIAESGDRPQGTAIKLKSSEFQAIEPGKPARLEFEPPPQDSDQTGALVTAGFVCIVEEKDSQRKSYYWVDINPVHPTEYVNPVFDREAAEGEIKFQIKARPNAPFPPEPAVLTLELPTESASPGKRTAEIPDPMAEDFLSARPERRRNILTHIHADGYPRAFVYDVNVAQRPGGAVRKRLREIKITSPATGTILGPVKSVPVAFLVDAPDAFRDSRTRLELSWSARAGGNRESRILMSDRDRMVRVTMQSDKEDATKVLIRPKVGDFELNLPTGGRENDELQISARLIEPDRPPLDSDAVLVYLDGSPPEIHALAHAEKIERGQPLSIAARVTDRSPIDTVVFALADRVDFDFEKLDVKKEATFDQESKQYIVQLPTDKLETGEKGLRYTVVARAKNANVEEWAVRKTETVLVVPKGAMSSAPEKSGHDLNGIAVAYGQPQPDATVQLAPKDNATASKITTPIGGKTSGPDGKFKFEGLPPGQYTLKGEAKVGANRWRGSVDVVVPAPQPVRLELKL